MVHEQYLSSRRQVLIAATVEQSDHQRMGAMVQRTGHGRDLLSLAAGPGCGVGDDGALKTSAVTVS